MKLKLNSCSGSGRHARFTAVLQEASSVAFVSESCALKSVVSGAPPAT